MSFAQNRAFFKNLEQQVTTTNPIPPKSQIRISVSGVNFKRLKNIEESSFGNSNVKNEQPIEENIKIREDFNDIPCPLVLLLGQTGGGKR